jgi:methionyl-tRNA formyltransferase
MAAGDSGNVGTTLLRVDAGVDTGPVFGHFRVEADPGESHVILQHRAVLDHLGGIRETLQLIECGRARPVDTNGHRSAVWGQPWLTALIRMRARERHTNGARLRSESRQ